MDKRNLIIMVKCEIGRTYDVAAEIADLPEGPIVYSTSGDYDLFTMFRLGNNDDIGHYVCETIPGHFITALVIILGGLAVAQRPLKRAG